MIRLRRNDVNVDISNSNHEIVDAPLIRSVRKSNTSRHQQSLRVSRISITRVFQTQYHCICTIHLGQLKIKGQLLSKVPAWRSCLRGSLHRIRLGLHLLKKTFGFKNDFNIFEFGPYRICSVVPPRSSKESQKTSR